MTNLLGFVKRKNILLFIFVFIFPPKPLNSKLLTRYLERLIYIILFLKCIKPLLVKGFIKLNAEN